MIALTFAVVSILNDDVDWTVQNGQLAHAKAPVLVFPCHGVNGGCIL
jgi:hypothetical protein